MTKRIFIIVLIIAAALQSCREKYEPVIIETNLNYLVVDGILVGGQDSTKILLSRTRKLDAGAASIVEPGATITVEDDNGNAIYYLRELTSVPGTYAIDGMNLIPGNSYKLHISTSNGKNYISGNIIFKPTPAIDSISWNKPDKNVNISVSTNDPQNKTKYYRWQYEETWEYFSPFMSSLVYDEINDEVIPRNPTDSINHCWRTQYSSDILIASTESFSQDIIVNQLMRTIPYGAFELSNKYSILVKQYALNKEGFEYLQILKRISEQSGSLFAAQPSQLSGNMRNVSDTNETVIGYVTASSLAKSRIFIERSEVEPWGYSLACSEKFVIDNPDSVKFYFKKEHQPQYIPLIYVPGIVSGYLSAEEACTDCRALGGVNRKPDFWQ